MIADIVPPLVWCLDVCYRALWVVFYRQSFTAALCLPSISHNTLSSLNRNLYDQNTSSRVGPRGLCLVWTIENRWCETCSLSSIDVINVYKKFFVNVFIILSTFISIKITWAKRSKIMTGSQAIVHCVRIGQWLSSLGHGASDGKQLPHDGAPPTEKTSRLVVGWLNEIFVTWRTKAPNLARGTLRVHLLILA